MNPITRLKQWIGSDDEASLYVCVYCGADLNQNYQECPECGRPYVTSKTAADAEGDDKSV